jgi:mono/diheme cytochrome c family protein
MFACRLAIGFVLATLTVALAGCGNSGPADSSPKGLFDANCARCHAQAGEPGGPPAVGSSKGPNLKKIGSEPGRTVDWLTEYIRDPKSKKPNPKMEGFGGKLKDEEIRSLAEYLAAMK